MSQAAEGRLLTTSFAGKPGLAGCLLIISQGVVTRSVTGRRTLMGFTYSASITPSERVEASLPGNCKPAQVVQHTCICHQAVLIWYRRKLVR